MPAKTKQSKTSGKPHSLSKRAIIVKLRDSAILNDDEELELQLRSKGMHALPRCSKLKPSNHQLRRLFRALTSEEKKKIENKARLKNPLYKPPQLFSRYFVLDLPPKRNREALLKELGSWKEHVEKAYVAPKVVRPDVNFV